jgi:hypothetical protein
MTKLTLSLRVEIGKGILNHEASIVVPDQISGREPMAADLVKALAADLARRLV